MRVDLYNDHNSDMINEIEDPLHNYFNCKRFKFNTTPSYEILNTNNLPLFQFIIQYPQRFKNLINILNLFKIEQPYMHSLLDVTNDFLIDISNKEKYYSVIYFLAKCKNYSIENFIYQYFPDYNRQYDEIGEEEICSICLNPLDNDLCITKCYHTFHRKCIKKYFKSILSFKCPLCRFSF